MALIRYVAVAEPLAGFQTVVLKSRITGLGKLNKLGQTRWLRFVIIATKLLHPKRWILILALLIMLFLWQRQSAFIVKINLKIFSMERS